jgi:cardiolipin synthase
LLGYNGYVPIWLIIIIVSRDIAIFGAVIISWMLGTNLRIEPLIISKVNTFLQIFYIVTTFIVILNNQILNELTTSIHGITTYLIAISTILSWMSYLKVWLINVNSIDENY